MKYYDLIRAAAFSEAPLPRAEMVSPVRVFLVAVLLVSGTVTLPQAISVGTSGLGAWTMLIAALGWALWLARPYFPRELIKVLFPLALFTVYMCLSVGWGGASIQTYQISAVQFGFVAFLLLGARECERRPGFAVELHRATDVAAVMAAVGYTLTVAVHGEGGDAFWGDRPLFMARPFALFACVAVARQLARWQAGERAGLWVAAWLVVLVYLSQSRLALVVVVGLFPLSYIFRGDRRNVGKGIVIAALAAGALGAGIFLYQPMYDRFFGFDASLRFGGVAVNASGRTAMWETLLKDIHGSHLVFGKGIGAASRAIDVYFYDLGHPHNDFLRYLYDLGGLGLGLFVWFLAAAFWTLAAAVRRAARTADPDLPLHLAPLLGLSSLVAAMCTDNPVTYVYVMAPLGILTGCALSRLRPRPVPPVRPRNYRRERMLALPAPGESTLPVESSDLQGKEPRA